MSRRSSRASGVFLREERPTGSWTAQASIAFRRKPAAIAGVRWRQLRAVRRDFRVGPPAAARQAPRRGSAQAVPASLRAGRPPTAGRRRPDALQLALKRGVRNRGPEGALASRSCAASGGSGCFRGAVGFRPIDCASVPRKAPAGPARRVDESGGSLSGEGVGRGCSASSDADCGANGRRPSFRRGSALALTAPRQAVASRAGKCVAERRWLRGAAWRGACRAACGGRATGGGSELVTAVQPTYTHAFAYTVLPEACVGGRPRMG